MNRTLLSMSALGCLPVLMASTGCATLVCGSTQKVAITSHPSGARVEVLSAKGRVIETVTTPAHVSLPRSEGYFRPASVTLRSEHGDTQREKPVQASVNPWYVGNVLFGGLIGFLIVDPLTGAMFSFPDKIDLDLSPPAELSDAKPREPQPVVAHRGRAGGS